MSRRVVVTGTGILSPIGNSTQEFLNGLKSGANGIGSISLFDSSDFNVHIAGELKINMEDHFEKRDLNRMDRFTAIALIASTEAISDIIDGIKNGLTLLGELSRFLCCFSKVFNPPIPDPIITPIRFLSSLSSSILA